jgi:hypothetical protein
MSAIMDMAKEIDNQLQALEHRSDFLESQLRREKEKNKKMIYMIANFLCELQEVMNHE